MYQDHSFILITHDKPYSTTYPFILLSSAVIDKPSLCCQQSGPTVTESLYRHKEVLETIFRTFDKDSSGCLSMAEFSEACQILTRHAGLSLQPEQISDIARSLDLNHDGHIDFNEFLEAFRIVDSQERRGRAAMLFDIPEKEDGEEGEAEEKQRTPKHGKMVKEKNKLEDKSSKLPGNVFKHLSASLPSDSSNRHTESIRVEICHGDSNGKDNDPRAPSPALSTSSWVDIQRAKMMEASGDA